MSESEPFLNDSAKLSDGRVYRKDAEVQGCCFIARAHSTSVLSVNAAVVDALSSLMLVAAVALILPTILYSTLPTEGEDINGKILSFSQTHLHVFLNEKDDVDHETYGDSIKEPLQQQVNEATREASESQEEDDRPLASNVYSAITTLIILAALITKCTQYFIRSLNKTA
ncbi:hypothetical protein V499_00031 [Pseudogymnoascus sp. VKM F-103]|nr:hypothetical protein V499_00031 [Pseudogymnoascus sp. VKM F-103]